MVKGFDRVVRVRRVVHDGARGRTKAEARCQVQRGNTVDGNEVLDQRWIVECVGQEMTRAGDGVGMCSGCSVV